MTREGTLAGFSARNQDRDVNVYHIVKIGDPPGFQSSTSRGGTCSAWSDFKDKANTEVIEVDLATGEILRRFTPDEADKLVYEFRHPKIA